MESDAAAAGHAGSCHSALALRFLEFRYMSTGAYGAPLEPQALAWQQLWRNLHSLTHLEVENCDLHDHFLLGIGQLKQLESLDLRSNELRHGDTSLTYAAMNCAMATPYGLAPLPPSLTALYLSGHPNSGWRVNPPPLDVSSILAPKLVEASSAATNHGLQDVDASTQRNTPAASLELLDIYGLYLLDPGVLCGLTRLTALHAGCVYSRQPLGMLTAIESLPQMRSLDLSVQKTCDSPYKQGNPHKTEPNPILQTAQLARLASSCTGLESLKIAVDMTGTGAHVLAQYAAADASGNSDYGIGPCSLASLQQLSCLTHLDLTALMATMKWLRPKVMVGFKTTTWVYWQRSLGCEV